MYPILEEVKKLAETNNYRRIPVCKELYADRYTPVEVMRVLRKASKHCYLLESASQTEVWGRYAGICIPAIQYFAGKIPILGVCLGHQSICQEFGGEITYAKELMHGKKKEIRKTGKSRLLKGLGDTFPATRYHSLAANRDTLPAELKVTAVSEDGEVMAVEHILYPVFGVQFHPESVMTEDGKVMIENFMEVVRHD